MIAAIGRCMWIACVAACTADDDLPPAPPCLADDFEDGTLDVAQWEQIEPGSPFKVVERDGYLEITLRANTSGRNGVVSRRAHDLTDGRVETRLYLAPTGPRVLAAIELTSSTARFAMIAGYGTFTAFASTGETVSEMFGEQSQHRFRHDSAAGTIVFEAYRFFDDTWRTIHTAPSPASLDFEVRLFADATELGNQSPGAALYDHVRVTNAACP